MVTVVAVLAAWLFGPLAVLLIAGRGCRKLEEEHAARVRASLVDDAIERNDRDALLVALGLVEPPLPLLDEAELVAAQADPDFSLADIDWGVR